MEIERLFVSLFLDAKNYAQGLADAQREGQGWAQRMRASIGGGIQTAGKMAVGALAGIGVAAVGAFGLAGRAAIDMNATLETSTLQFETLMGDADRAEEHIANLFEFAKKTPFETQPIIDASRMLQTFGGDALNSMDNLTLLGDAAAATNAPFDDLGFWVGRLFANLQAGQPFGEAAARLQELAVLSPEARQQMEQLQEAGGDASEVFAIFQEDLGRFSGAMERQAGTWQGLTSTISDALNITVATALRPFFEMAQSGLGWLADFLSSDAVTAGAERFAEVMSAVGEGVGFFVEALRQGYDPATAFGVAWGMIGNALGLSAEQIQTVREFIVGLMTQVTAVVEPVVTWIKNNVELKDVLIALGLAIASVIVPAILSVAAAAAPVLAGFALLVAAVAIVRRAWEENWGGIQEKTAAVVEFVSGLIAFLKDWWAANSDQIFAKARDIWERIRGVIEIAILAVQAIITTIATAIQTFWAEHGEAIVAKAQEAWELIKTTISNFLDLIKQVWETWSSLFKGDFEGFGTNLYELWKSAWTLVVDFLSGLWDMIKPVLASVWDSLKAWWGNIDWKQLGQSIIDGIVTGLRNAGQAVFDALGGIVDAAIADIKARLGIGSPSRVTAQIIGKPMAEGVAVGWEETLSRANLNGSLQMALAGVSPKTTNFSSQTTVQLAAGQDPLRALRASRHLDKLAVAAL